jgi:hypothetical protein
MNVDEIRGLERFEIVSQKLNELVADLCLDNLTLQHVISINL